MKEFDDLVKIIQTLRGENGCDWDKKQTFESMKKYILEEVYELFDAIENKNTGEIQEELGDILMHMTFLSQMAAEKNWFDIRSVLKTINKKLIARHPHVFSDTKVSGVEDILKNWEEIKKQEKQERKYYLDGIPKSLPAIIKTSKIQEKLSRIGFKWGSMKEMIAKVDEELEELKVEIKKNDMEKAKSELGDVLFTVIGVALMGEIDPESALQQTNQKVINRFNFIEQYLEKQNRKLDSASIEELEKIWLEAKKYFAR